MSAREADELSILMASDPSAPPPYDPAWRHAFQRLPPDGSDDIVRPVEGASQRQSYTEQAVRSSTEAEGRESPPDPFAAQAQRGSASDDSLTDVVVDTVMTSGAQRSVIMATHYNHNKVPSSHVGESYTRNGTLSEEHINLCQPENKSKIRWKRVGISSAAHLGTIFFLSITILLIRSSMSTSYFIPAMVAAALFTIVSYVIIIVEGLTSETFKYARRALSYDEALSYIAYLSSAWPTIKLIAECSHQEIVKNKSKKIVTHKEEAVFRFTRMMDGTEEIPEDVLEEGSIMRFEVQKRLDFLDENTRHQYEKKKQQMSVHNRRLDEDFELREVIEIVGCNHHFSVYDDQDVRVEFFRMRWYCLFTFLLLTWPYRCFFSLFTKKRSLTVTKAIGI